MSGTPQEIQDKKKEVEKALRARLNHKKHQFADFLLTNPDPYDPEKREEYIDLISKLIAYYQVLDSVKKDTNPRTRENRPSTLESLEELKSTEYIDSLAGRIAQSNTLRFYENLGAFRDIGKTSEDLRRVFYGTVGVKFAAEERLHKERQEYEERKADLKAYSRLGAETIKAKSVFNRGIKEPKITNKADGVSSLNKRYNDERKLLAAAMREYDRYSDNNRPVPQSVVDKVYNCMAKMLAYRQMHTLLASLPADIDAETIRTVVSEEAAILRADACCPMGKYEKDFLDTAEFCIFDENNSVIDELCTGTIDGSAARTLEEKFQENATKALAAEKALEKRIRQEQKAAEDSEKYAGLSPKNKVKLLLQREQTEIKSLKENKKYVVSPDQFKTTDGYEKAQKEMMNKFLDALEEKISKVIAYKQAEEKIVSAGSKLSKKDAEHLLSPWTIHSAKEEIRQSYAMKQLLPRKNGYFGLLETGILTEEIYTLGDVSTPKAAKKADAAAASITKRYQTLCALTKNKVKNSGKEMHGHEPTMDYN